MRPTSYTVFRHELKTGCQGRVSGLVSKLANFADACGCSVMLSEPVVNPSCRDLLAQLLHLRILEELVQGLGAR